MNFNQLHFDCVTRNLIKLKTMILHYTISMDDFVCSLKFRFVNNKSAISIENQLWNFFETYRGGKKRNKNKKILNICVNETTHAFISSFSFFFSPTKHSVSFALVDKMVNYLRKYRFRCKQSRIHCWSRLMP